MERAYRSWLGKRCSTALLVLTVAASAARADVATNCFHLVTYLPGTLYHIEADVTPYASFDFALDRCGDSGWRVGDHGSTADVCFEKTVRHHTVSYLDFQAERGTVSFGGTTNLYCAFTWNSGGIKHSTADNLGWFHLRERDGVLELVSSGVERQEGYRIDVEPDGWPLQVEQDEQPEEDTWLDPATGIRWRYTDYGTYCGLGTSCECESAIADGKVPVDLSVPGSIAGLPVGRIERDAFYGEDVRRVTLPTSVTEIAMCAFAGSNVERIEIAEGNPAFRVLDGFVVSADGTVLVVAPHFVDFCEIPESVAVIGAGAFAGCKCANSELVIPRNVREIRAYAFLNTTVGRLDFWGDAPILDPDAFTSGSSHFDIRFRIGTNGWPCAFELQGHETEALDDVRDEGDETERERIDADGCVWNDRIQSSHRVERVHGKTDAQWTRSDFEWWETNITTRQVSPVKSDVIEDVAHGWRNIEIDYWDLECVRERREWGEWVDHTETSKGGVFDVKTWKYDSDGRLVWYENSERYDNDAVDPSGLVEVEEKRTVKYPDDGVVWDETVRKSTYDDGTTMTEERHITLTHVPHSRTSIRNEGVYVVLRDGSVREEEHYTERKFADEGWLKSVEQDDRVTEDGFCWDYNDAVEYGMKGEVVSRSTSASLNPVGYGATLIPLVPGSSCEVSAKDETEALSQVSLSCSLPKDVECKVDISIQDYFGYFKRTAVRIGEGRWRVEFEVDQEAISLPKTVEVLAGQMSSIASGTADDVTLMCKPGLWYGIGYSESPSGPYVCDHYKLSEGDVVSLPAPLAKPRLFMRIIVRSVKPQ